MKLKILLLSSFILITSLINTVRGQTFYGLKECIEIGLDRNFSIKIARNSETISTNNYTIGNAGFLPSLDLSGRYGGTLNNTRQNLTDGTQNVTNDIFNTTSNAGVTMGLTVFNGFNVQTTYKKLNELKQVGELNTQLSIENLVANIITSYYNYIENIQLLNNLEYAVTLSKERLRIDEDRYLLGSSSKLQVLQSRVYLNSDSSRLSRQFEVVRRAQIQLNELMAVQDLAIEFITRDSDIVVDPSLIFEKLLEETLDKNTSLLISKSNKTISEYDYKLAVSRSYPYLNLTSGYSYNFNTFSSSSIKNQTTNGLNYGLTMGLTIFDGMNQRRNIRNSSIELQNRELRYLELEQGVRADLIAIYSGYSNNLRLITLE